MGTSDTSDTSRRGNGYREGVVTSSTGNEKEPGLSPYTIRELASWYIEEAARRGDDPDLAAVGALQKAIDRDLRLRLADLGVFPEFIAAELERVMQVVFTV